MGRYTWNCLRQGKRIEKRTAEFNKTDSSMYQELWDLESFVSYWQNLFSKLYDGSSEVCYLGIAFRKIPRPRWRPVLESQLQGRRACEHTVPSTHNVVDRWSGDGKINARSCNVAVKWRAHRLSRFWNASYEDCVCVEKDHLQYLSKRRVSGEEQRTQKHNRFLRGRQVAYMIYDHFRATGAYDAAQGLSDLFNICLHNDAVQDFDARWDQSLLTASEIPTENVLEGLYKLQKSRFCSASDRIGFARSRNFIEMKQSQAIKNWRSWQRVKLIRW